ncbi:MAG: hypothetical protein ACOX0F_07210 [Syntrophomonadaceae bacterium]|jgi:hypothetical protein
MTVVVCNHGIALQGKISEILACLQAVPGDMFLQEYIRINLH